MPLGCSSQFFSSQGGFLTYTMHLQIKLTYCNETKKMTLNLQTTRAEEPHGLATVGPTQGQALDTNPPIWSECFDLSILI